MSDNNKGFTLIEVLLAMAIAGIVMGSIYSIYYSQQKSYIAQEQAVAMQQNLRAAMFYMTREIRMAGCDPTDNAGAGIQTANTNSIRFTLDITGGESDGKDNDNDGSVDEADENKFSDGFCDDTNEDITYSLYTADGIQKLGRKSPSTANNQPVAENIDALDFVYLDANGATTATLANIRSVKITLVARTGREDPGYTNNEQFYNQNPDGQELIYTALNDSFRRRRLTTTIKCRNLGL